MSTAKQRCSPFAQLVAPAPIRLPLGPSSILVVDGQRIDNVCQMRPLGPDADSIDRERAAETRREIDRARARARYQRDRLDAEKMARRAAYTAANREKTAAWKREYDLKRRDQTRKLQAAWARRERLINPEAQNERSRRYYERNRERVLQRGRERRLAKKAGAALRVIPTGPHWTAARQAWLECVAVDPLNKRQQGQVAHQCEQFGWTEWQRDAAGRRVFHERLTASGQVALAQWRVTAQSSSTTQLSHALHSAQP